MVRHIGKGNENGESGPAAEARATGTHLGPGSKRNYVERLKHEKAPMEVISDLPELIGQGYEAISEEDVVRLQWYGRYHDKPKVGHFMMRVKLPGGSLTPHKLRTIGRVSQDFGGDYGELTTRQNIQLHGMKLNDLPEIFATLTGPDFPRAVDAETPCGTSRDARWRGLPPTNSSTPARSSRRPPISSTANPTTATSLASTRSPFRAVRTSATRLKSTASA